MTGPRLRPWTASDAAALRDAFLTTPDLVTQLGGADLSSIEAAEAHISGPLASDDAHRIWAIVDGGVAIGSVGVSAIDRRHDTAWLHYWLAGSGRGRGLATRALAGAA
ncbi:N-acetyltransferase, partial [Clavibacter nebraskensis]